MSYSSPSQETRHPSSSTTMTEFVSPLGPLPYIPDDLTLPQFILDSTHGCRPSRRPQGTPWLIEDATGRKVGYKEIQSRVSGLANALSLKWAIAENDVVCIYSPNHVDYPTIIWAVHRLGAIVTGANPSYTPEELAFQVSAAKAAVLVVHPDVLERALVAAQQVGIPPHHVIPIGAIHGPVSSTVAPDLDQLIDYGLAHRPNFVERRLSPGEGKTKVAFLSFSSGTTGKPKVGNLPHDKKRVDDMLLFERQAVEIPHYAPIANIVQMATCWKINDDSVPLESRRIRQGDIALALLPFYHIYGLIVNLHFFLFCGISIVVVPRFEFVKFLESVKKHGATHLLMVPPMVLLLCKHPATKNYDFSHVRLLLCGAAPLSADLTETLTSILPNAHIGQGYGMTETSTTVCMFPLSQKIGTHGSAGQLIPGVRARILKEDGTLAKVGEPGELCINTPALALGYLNNEKATAETFIGDRWIRTGDTVIIDKNNDMFVVDRVKEILKVRGFQVAPAEIEGHLLQYPEIIDVCVVGFPDDYSGEVPLAYVVLSADAARRAAQSGVEATKIKDSILKHVSDHKAPYKRLAGVEFIDAIPKNASGKLLRRVLRDKAMNSRQRRSLTFTKAHL
ncbi:amp dependent CoA ligase [Russula earlei]|uniref:Amp dependent CoA ligase n=1 Tax=Russula earlei TaxID=71964 RepID=A0ACC0U3G9_9AGAM|nr:amp dependent CoA ligase [Russula earlei]